MFIFFSLQTTSQTITHEKGTLVGSILGVIYLELGFPVLLWIVLVFFLKINNLKCQHNSKSFS